MQKVTDKYIYKMVYEKLWNAWIKLNEHDLPGAKLYGFNNDIRDGFIHCSTMTQVPIVRAKKYTEPGTLLLLTIDTTELNGTVKLENGYNHIYGYLTLKDIVKISVLE